MYLSTNQREQILGAALARGFNKHGVEVRSRLRSDFWNYGISSDSDAVVFVGVKSRKMWQACIDQGRWPLLIDKSYFGRGEYYRLAYKGYQPPYLSKMHCSTGRLHGMGVSLQPRKGPGEFVLFAGSSNKFHLFHELEKVGDYAVRVCAELQQVIGGRMPIWYRPKPSWWANKDETDQKVVPAGTILSGPTQLFSSLLPRCHTLVTYGSNAAAEALAAGVPVLMLSPEGISPVWHLCEHDVSRVLDPYWPNGIDRDQTLANLAWCQFTLAEIEAGLAWNCIKQWN